MSCCALKSNYNACRNWSLVDSNFCHIHQDMTPELFKERWMTKYIIGKDRCPYYTVNSCPHKAKKILSDLRNRVVILSQEDIRKIPVREAYVDIYLLLLENNFAQHGDHPRMEFASYWFYVSILYNFPHLQNPHQEIQSTLGILKALLEKHLILSSGKSLFTFLEFMGGTSKGRARLTKHLHNFIPTLLDTDAAKEMSWMSFDELDKLRQTYEKELGVDHTLTKCLVQRWLLDIKELYHTEKAIQKLKMDHCKEELMMNRWHPDRLRKYLEMGYEIEQLDDIM
jgi:hypothetical protein